MSRKLSVLWTKHLRDKEEIKRLTEFVLSSTPVLDTLAGILERKMQENEVFKKEDYKDPSWAYACADRNGYVRALTEIVTLLRGIDHDDHTNNRK